MKNLRLTVGYMIWELPSLKINRTPQFDINVGAGEIELS